MSAHSFRYAVAVNIEKAHPYFIKEAAVSVNLCALSSSFTIVDVAIEQPTNCWASDNYSPLRPLRLNLFLLLFKPIDFTTNLVSYFLAP